jgi:hypothetical protein
VNTLHFQAVQQIEIQEARNDAGITGWDNEAIELVLDGDLDQCTTTHREGKLTINSHVALALRVPRRIAIELVQVSGDLVLRQLDGVISIDAAGGDLSIHSCAAQITIGRVHGSLNADHLAGALSIEDIEGDTRLGGTSAVRLGHAHGAVDAHDIDGTLEMQVVEGDVRAHEVTGPVTLQAGKGSFQGIGLYGGMNLDDISDDLSLKTDVTPGLAYSARTRGTIDAHFPAETSAHFRLSAQGLVSAILPRIEQQEPGHLVGSAGAAEAEVDLQAAGDLTVRVQEPGDGDWDAWTPIDSISTQIEAEMARHIGEMNIEALTQREIDQAVRKAEQELAQAQRRLEEEQRRAQDAALQAQERAARAAQRAQLKIARQSRRWGVSGEQGPSLFGLPQAPRPPRATDRGPSSEEQLAVLNMLQEKKITVAEAEDLLAALGS